LDVFNEAHLVADRNKEKKEMIIV